MFNFRNLTALFLGIVLFTVVSCKKDDDPATPSTREVLTSKTWTYNTSSTTSTNTDAQQTIALSNALLINAKFNFNNDNSYKFTPADTTILDPETGTWALSSDSKTLTIVSGGDSSPFTIQSATSSELALAFSDTTSTGVSYPIVLKLK